MASVAARNSIAVYERNHNDFLGAVRPGGILYDVNERGPFEALLLPRESVLRTWLLTPFLRLPAWGHPPRQSVRSSAVSPATSCPSSPMVTSAAAFSPTPGSRGAFTDAGQGSGSFAGTPSPLLPHAAAAAGSADATVEDALQELELQLSSIGPEPYQRVKEALTRFLRYHLIHFTESGSSVFLTAQGQRGEFSDALDTVQRYGRLGKINVVTDMDAVISNRVTGKNSSGSSSPSPAPHHPTTLQVFVIDRPLMDEQELQQLSQQLHSVVKGAKPVAKLPAPVLMAPAPSPHDKQRPVVAAPTSAVPTLSSYFREPPPPSGAGGAVAESAAIPPVIPSFRPPGYEDACARPTTPPPLLRTAADGAARQPLPDAVGHPSVRVNGARADDTTLYNEDEDVIVEEDLTPYVSKSTRQRARANEARRRSDEGPQTGPGSAPAAVGVTNPPPAPSASPTEHANLLTHQYSKESIMDYRRVVAADNDINYSEFERLMASKDGFPLAKLVSNFIEAAQTRGKKFRSNHSFDVLTESVRETVETIPRFSSSAHRMTILGEGVEKYVTTKLYFMFYNVDEKEQSINTQLQEKFQSLEHLTAAQLDAMEEVERHHVWGQAMFELDGMNFFKSPREKLRCGMRACELLSLAVGDILSARQRKAKGATSHAPAGPKQPLLAFGADEFLPCFMLLVLRAQPYCFYQNLQFIDKYRTMHLRSSEESYCLANMMAAAEFWMHCDSEGKLGDTGSSPHGARGAAEARAQGGPATGSSEQVPKDHVPTAVVKTGKHGSPLQVSRGRVVAVPPPPMMGEEDLLPSVRQASAMSFRGKHPHSSTAVPTLSATEKAGKVMDALFGWTRPSTAPEVSGGDRPVQATAATAAPRAREPEPRTLADNKRPAPSAIHDLLVVQNKPFEQLTEAELRAIVEEARALHRSP